MLVSPLGAPEHLYGLAPLEVLDGDRVRGAMTTAPWMSADPGRPEAGVLAVLVDVVVGHATLFARPADHWAVTTALSIDVARAPTGDGRLEAHGELVVADGGAALARGDITDAHGSVATATIWTRFVPGEPDFAGLDAGVGQRRRAHARTAREALGGVVDRDVDGRSRLTLAPDPLLRNVNGAAHGGLVAAAADVLAAAATDEETAPLRTASMQVSFLRPLAIEGPIALVTDVVHRGRRTALTDVEVRDADGRRCVTARVAGRSAGEGS